MIARPLWSANSLMIIGGLEKFSLIDFPGHLSAVVFTQGCNFRCQFCYNPMLVLPQKRGELKNISVSVDAEQNQTDHSLDFANTEIKESDLFDFLRDRTGKLDGVVVSGGEPTMHADLLEFLEKIKTLGFAIKLDTNGTNPQMLKNLLEKKLIDYIAMDIKAPLDKYDLVTGANNDLRQIEESISLIRESGLGYEFRSTIVPSLHSSEDIKKMGSMISGADKWYLQNFKADTELVNENFQNGRSFTEGEMGNFLAIAKDYVKTCAVR